MLLIDKMETSFKNRLDFIIWLYNTYNNNNKIDYFEMDKKLSELKISKTVIGDLRKFGWLNKNQNGDNVLDLPHTDFNKITQDLIDYSRERHKIIRQVIKMNNYKNQTQMSYKTKDKPTKMRNTHSREKSYSLRLQFALWLISNKDNHFPTKTVEDKLIELQINRSLKTICFRENILKRVDDYFLTVNKDVINKYTPVELCNHLIKVSKAYLDKSRSKSKEMQAKLMYIQKNQITSLVPTTKNENLQIVLDTLNAIHTKLDNISKAIGLNANA